MRAQDQEQQSRVIYELCSIIIQILNSPLLPIPTRNPYAAASSSSRQPVATLTHVSPTAFAFLFIGISGALMLFESITFFIGFILMPWVVGLVLLFYFAGIVSNLSEFGKSILSPPPRHGVHEWSFS